MMFYSKIRSGVIHDQSYSKKFYWIEYLEIAVHTTQNLIIISAHADGGPHFVSAHARHSAQPPIDMSRNFFATRVCIVGFKNLGEK